MADDDTSSADPQALLNFAEVGLRIDAQLEVGAMQLQNALDEFAATCTEYGNAGIDFSLAKQLRDFARRGVEFDLWVRWVAEQFLQADAGAVVSPTVEFNADARVLAQQDWLGPLWQAVVAALPPDVAMQVVVLLDAGNVEGALRVAAVLPITAGALQSGLDTGSPAALGSLAGVWNSTRDAIGAGFDRLAEALPDLSYIQLDPNGPIARQARGQPINPFDWSRELAGYESQFVLAGAPAEVRNAQVTVTLPGVGDQTLTAGALVALAMDPANLIGMAPVEGPTEAVLGRALPYLEGPARAAVSRLLTGIAPELAARIIDDAASAANRTGLGERIMQRSILKASESSAAAEAVGGLIDYGAMDELGRPSGIRAVITDGMTQKGFGSKASGELIPPGYQMQEPALARGHLLGKQLGGSGDVYDNLVTLFQNDANHPNMSSIEATVRAAVEGGQVVDYAVTPIYEGMSRVPTRVHIRAVGRVANGAGDALNLDVLIENVSKVKLPGAVQP